MLVSSYTYAMVLYVLHNLKDKVFKCRIPGCTLFFLFSFFFFKKYELIYEFGSEKYAKTGNLDLENLIKAEMDNFDEGIWCYLSVRQAVTQMVGDGGERQLQVVTRCSH